MESPLDGLDQSGFDHGALLIGTLDPIHPQAYELTQEECIRGGQFAGASEHRR